MTAAHLVVEGLVAGYGAAPVIVDVGLEVDAGEVVCLLGANGAGKSTTLAAMTGLLRPTAGSVRLAGVELLGRRPHRTARAGVAHVPEDRSLFPSLTVGQHLRLGARRSGGRRDLGPLAEVLAWFPALDRLHDRPAGLLSGGEQQMLAIARALMGRPQVLLIDEMSLGLAPLVVSSLLDSITALAADAGCAVLLVEQHVALALAAADRAYVLSRGRITYAGPAATLAGDHDLLLTDYFGGSNSITAIGS
ncbi:MAG: ABC transporter ATP-binding protein [Acidimicrobiales bacterium]